MRHSTKFKPIYPAVLLSVFAVVAAVMRLEGEPGEAAAEAKMHVYLVIGEAAMGDDVGGGVGLERCHLLNAEDQWEPAKGPWNRHSTIRGDEGVPKLGPAYGFAKEMLAQDESLSIGLVVNMGSAAKPEEWGMKTRNYREARRRTKAAMKTGTLKGVIWQGGGSRDPLRTDLDHLKTLIADLRADLRLLNLPVVVGELPGAPSVNAQLAALAADVHATAVAGSEGLVGADQHELDADGMMKLGARCAGKMRELQAAWDRSAAARQAPLIPIIDTHVHAFANRAGGLDGVARWMAKNGVEQCIVSPIGQSRATTPEERETMLASYRAYQGRIHRFCLIEPGEVESVEEAVRILEKEKAEGAIGFGEHYGRGLMFDDPKNLLLYEACERVGLPVMFHIDSSKNMVEAGMRRVERVLEMFPECRVIAHAYWWLQLPDGTCDRMLQNYPNLYADVSGVRMAGILNRDRGYSREFLIRNADKVLFGSDAGWWSFGKGIDDRELQFALFEELDLPEDVRRKIYRGNAERLFGLAGE